MYLVVQDGGHIIQKGITLTRRYLDYSAHGQLGPVRDSSAQGSRQLGPGVETARPNDKWYLLYITQVSRQLGPMINDMMALSFCGKLQLYCVIVGDNVEVECFRAVVWITNRHHYTYNLLYYYIWQLHDPHRSPATTRNIQESASCVRTDWAMEIMPTSLPVWTELSTRQRRPEFSRLYKSTPICERNNRLDRGLRAIHLQCSHPESHDRCWGQRAHGDRCISASPHQSYTNWSLGRHTRSWLCPCQKWTDNMQWNRTKRYSYSTTKSSWTCTRGPPGYCKDQNVTTRESLVSRDRQHGREAGKKLPGLSSYN